MEVQALFYDGNETFIIVTLLDIVAIFFTHKYFSPNVIEKIEVTGSSEEVGKQMGKKENRR